jgi:uncharacterized membrane protein
MPWCGVWGTVDGGFWWLMPLFGLLFMGLMAVVCFRGVGCIRGRRPSTRELSDLQREVEGLREEVRKLVRQPS